MNFSGVHLVAARGSALPVSYRKHGSANGNRTCFPSVQLGSVRSKSLQLRSVRTVGTAKAALQMPDVAARWQRGRRESLKKLGPEHRHTFLADSRPTMQEAQCHHGKVDHATN